MNNKTIDPRLLNNKYGVIDPFNGDCIGRNTERSILYERKDLIENLQPLLVGDVLYRNFRHKALGINTLSRDHVFRLKIACNYHDYHGFDEYFDSLKSNSYISPEHKMKQELYWYIQGRNARYQTAIFWRYCILAIQGSKLIRLLGGLKMESWDAFVPLQMLKLNKGKSDQKKIYPRHMLFNRKYDKRIKELGWSLWKYYWANSTWLFPGYSHRQLCEAIYYSKKVPVITWVIRNILVTYTWKGNFLIRALLGFKIHLLDSTLMLINLYRQKLNITGRFPMLGEDHKASLCKEEEWYKYRFNYDFFKKISK